VLQLIINHISQHIIKQHTSISPGSTCPGYSWYRIDVGGMIVCYNVPSVINLYSWDARRFLIQMGFEVLSEV
jgi:hypothetical protein